MANQRRWSKPWRFIFPRRFSLRVLMAAVLVVGLICGGIAHWRARQFRRQVLIVQLHIQEQVTDAALNQARNEMFHLCRNHTSSSGHTWGYDRWALRAGGGETVDGERIPWINIEVEGRCDGDVLRPLVIFAAGFPKEGPLIDRLIHEYRARGWPYQVVARPSAPILPGMARER
jgi:hypothetical protein